jgi:hypothetical protein
LLGSVSIGTVFSLVLMFQNTLMLFLSPLLIFSYLKNQNKSPAFIQQNQNNLLKNKYPPGVVRNNIYQGGEKWLLQKAKPLGSFSW